MIADLYAGLDVYDRIALALTSVLLAHGLVRAVRYVSHHSMQSAVARRMTNKTLTLISLITSVTVFALYFVTIGFVLTETGVPLSTYLASASIIGLAVAFGSQGIVQDVVSGLTIISTDLFDIGDVIEVSGQVGVVERFGMRFTVLRSPMGAEIFVPNRSILNVIAYPRGYVRCALDVSLPDETSQSVQVESQVRLLADSAQEQFPGIFRAPAEILPEQVTASGRRFIRLKFRIWPGRGGVLEGAFRQEVLQAIKAIVPDYPDWKVTVNFEIERFTPPKANRRAIH